MGDYYCTVIPTDPRWVPDEAHEAAALALFTDQMHLAPGHRDVTTSRPQKVTLHTGIQNFHRLRCPSCGSVLGEPAESESMAWFVEQLDRCHTDEHGFWPLDVVAPCCGAEISLNDLDEDSTMGFASWSLEAYRPQSDDLSGERQEELEAALGHPVRVIWVDV